MASNKTACVVGGSGFVASLLIKLLLEKGYAVNTTVADKNNEQKISHLISLQNLGDLKIFEADLSNEEALNAPISGCHFVFHLITPFQYASEDPESEMIRPALQGVDNVLKACVNAKTVKKVILTSSAAAVSINNHIWTGSVMDEKEWTDPGMLYSERPPAWGYAVSNTLAERAAWKFAEENNLQLITINPSLMTGPSLTSDISDNLHMAMALFTINGYLIEGLVIMQRMSGSISLTHVEDVCRAHIFLAEKESSSGRYICCAVNTSVPELAEFLHQRYPKFRIPSKFEGIASKPEFILSSEKLINEGFSFKYGLEDMYDQTVEFFKAKGVI